MKLWILIYLFFMSGQLMAKFVTKQHVDENGNYECHTLFDSDPGNPLISGGICHPFYNPDHISCININGNKLHIYKSILRAEYYEVYGLGNKFSGFSSQSNPGVIPNNLIVSNKSAEIDEVAQLIFHGEVEKSSYIVPTSVQVHYFGGRAPQTYELLCQVVDINIPTFF